MVRVNRLNGRYQSCLGHVGAEAPRILNRILPVQPRPENDPNTILLNEYLDLVYAEKWQEAE
ncbi:hypothetical protein [Endozoicomonas sp. SESOKO3]|uniref:hypothetical protein n=1 Tax=Endozoicomonas sp. SESOKO3 TaxID=2828744 RepID=UPI0021496245|nr:hypothetical protein [Endozoicomonas sp. SESOKO3]